MNRYLKDVHRQRCLLLILSIVIFHQSSAAQQENIGGKIVALNPDSLRGNLASIVFDKSFNTYHWNGAAFLNRKFGPVSVRFNEQFRSTLIRTEPKLITDNQNLDLRLMYNISENVDFGIECNSFILSDNKSIGGSISKASSHAIYASATYRPFDNMTVEPSLGTRFDIQFDQQDHGLSYLLGFSLYPSIYSGYLINTRGKFQYDKIDPRVMESYNATVRIEKSYFEQTRNYLSLSYYRVRRDFYFHADSTSGNNLPNFFNVETRSDNLFEINDSLRYTVSNKFSWSLYGGIASREITRLSSGTTIPGTTISNLRIEGGVRAMFEIHRRINSSISFSYHEKDEKHETDSESNIKRQEERRNNQARRSGIAGAISWVISDSDTLNISGSTHLLRYDTPSRENDDDRDEQLYLFNLSTRHRFGTVLFMKVDADLNIGHLVYLFASRSADNSWNRIIRLSPSVEYQPLNIFRTVNTFEVVANYTVYDFERFTSQVHSYVFRQFAFVDSSSISLTNKLRMDWLSHIRLYERGELKWNAFSERPINYFEEKTYLGSLSYIPSQGLLFSVGIRYFNQLQFGFSGKSRFVENDLRSVGPTTKIEISTGNADFSVYGWYERQSQTNQSNRGYATLVMALNVKI
ncbi:MAG: hypothetical protein HZB59_07955 [Ignavibacteriales bacterium]|nr:hypothetical protein [Ignavibacteriales bacterium]